MCEEEGRRLRELVVGRSILELGSGVGFVGLSLSALGASRVLCTDLPEQMPLLEKNLARGRRDDAGLLESCSFVWGTRPVSVFSGGLWNLAIACDCCYDLKCVPDLAASLHALTLEGAAVLISAPSRVDFAYHRCHHDSGDNAEQSALPDYEALIDALMSRITAQERSLLRVERVGSFPSSSFPQGSWPLGDTPPTVDVLMLQMEHVPETP